MKLPKTLAEYARKNNLNVSRHKVVCRKTGRRVGYTFDFTPINPDVLDTDQLGNINVLASATKEMGETWRVVVGANTYGGYWGREVFRLSDIRKFNQLSPDSRCPVHVISRKTFNACKIDF